MPKLTIFEAMKLSILRRQFGDKLSSGDALDCALQAEQFKNDCGPRDPAFTHFAYQQRSLEQMALLLEKEELAGAAG